jgi:hypothetical protein
MSTIFKKTYRARQLHRIPGDIHQYLSTSLHEYINELGNSVAFLRQIETHVRTIRAKYEDASDFEIILTLLNGDIYINVIPIFPTVVLSRELPQFSDKDVDVESYLRGLRG